MFVEAEYLDGRIFLEDYVSNFSSQGFDISHKNSEDESQYKFHLYNPKSVL